MTVPGCVRNSVIAFAIFFASAGFVPHFLLALVAGLLVFSRNLDALTPKEDDTPIVLFIALAYLNMAFHIDVPKSPEQFTSVGLIGMYFTFKIGKALPKSAALVTLSFAILEGAVILMKCIFVTIPIVVERLAILGSHETLVVYQERTVGLLPSVAASGFALVIGLILLELYKKSLSKRVVVLGYVLLLSGVLCNMSRAALLAVVCFYLILALRYGIRKWNVSPRRVRILMGTGLISFLAVLVGFMVNCDDGLLRALASGRLEIFRNAWQFVGENFLFGNGSWRYVDTLYRSPGTHAHNAFLEFYATHGAISFLVFAYMLGKINRRNVYYLVPLLVFNLFNYSIFYVYSFGDVILFFLLNQFQEESPEEAFAQEPFRKG